jgi:ribosomal protein S1
MINETKWAELLQRLPVNSQVMGVVLMHRPFGFFVQLDIAPAVSAIVDIISYRPDGKLEGPENWPPVGERVLATVSDYREEYQQIRLRIGPALNEMSEPDS